MLTQGQTERLGNRNEGPLDLQGRVDLRLQGTLRHTLLHNFKVNIISIYIPPLFIIRPYFSYLFEVNWINDFLIREQELSGNSITNRPLGIRSAFFLRQRLF